MSVGINRFDDNARSTLTRAHREAEQAHQSLIRPEHILLALLNDEGSAGKVLAEQSVDNEKLRRVVDDLTPESEKGKNISGRINLARETQQLLELTVDIVNKRKDPMIRSGHFLAALLKQNDSRVRSILDASGFDRDRLSKRTEEIMASPPEPRDLDDLLDTLNNSRRLLQGDAEQQKRIDTIQWILHDYFRRKR